MSMAEQQMVENGGAEKVDGAAAAVVFGAVKTKLLVEAPKASDAVMFYKAAFGADEISRSLHSKRKADQELPLVLAAQVKIGECTFVVADNAADNSPAALKNEGNRSVFCLETDDVDAAVAKAVSAGALSEGDITETEGEYCNGRSCKLKDPYGFVWLICSPEKKCAEPET